MNICLNLLKFNPRKFFLSDYKSPLISKSVRIHMGK